MLSFVKKETYTNQKTEQFYIVYVENEFDKFQFVEQIKGALLYTPFGVVRIGRLYTREHWALPHDYEKKRPYELFIGTLNCFVNICLTGVFIFVIPGCGE